MSMQPALGAAVPDSILGVLTPDTQRAVRALLREMVRAGWAPRVTSTVRTCAEQNAIYARGRTVPGTVVTRAQGCQSWHVLHRAIDLYLPGAAMADYTPFGVLWERWGGGWGGRFEGLDDVGHFEWHPGVTLHQICPDPTACASALVRSRELDLRGALPGEGLFGAGAAPAWAWPVAGALAAGGILWLRSR